MKIGPATAGIIFRFGAEKGGVTTNTEIGTRFKEAAVFPGERCLGGTLSGNPILIRI